MKPPSISNQFAHKLFRYLIDRGLSRFEFAAIMGVSAGIVSHWRTGARFPSRANFKKLIKISKGHFTWEDYLC